MRLASSSSPRFSPRFGTTSLYAAAGFAGEPVLEQLRVGSRERHRDVHLRRGNPFRVELLERRLKHVALGQIRRSLGAHGGLAELGDELDPLDHLAAAHLKDLDDRPRGTNLEPEGIAIAQLG